MQEVIIINAQRNGYSPSQTGQTLTAAELIEILQEYDENTPIFLSHDNGYTYGSIRERDISLDETEI